MTRTNTPSRVLRVGGVRWTTSVMTDSPVSEVCKGVTRERERKGARPADELQQCNGRGNRDPAEERRGEGHQCVLVIPNHLDRDGMVCHLAARKT